jgi:hypothetical protein
MSEWNYIIAAYTLSWVTVIGYAGYAWMRLRRSERALAEVESKGGNR